MTTSRRAGGRASWTSSSRSSASSAASRPVEVNTTDAPSEVPTEHQHPPRRKAESVVLVNTGHGKGKSTAAFGVIVRGVARGWEVGVVQFIKSGKWRTGEEA